jgi:molecular chaperone GrpE
MKKNDASTEPPAPGPDPAPAGGDSLAELDSMKDRHMRLQADFDNFRKRTLRERAELQVRATEDLVRELLPVLDHFEFGLRTASEHHRDAAVRDGFQLVYDELLRVLQKAGVVPVEAAAGSPFDPHQHEAVTHVPSAEQPADTVLLQSRRGYRLGERLLRPAQVVVSSGPAVGAPPETGDDAAADSATAPDGEDAHGRS